VTFDELKEITKAGVYFRLVRIRDQYKYEFGTIGGISFRAVNFYETEQEAFRALYGQLKVTGLAKEQKDD
jgi:hypothetical protein